MIKVFTYCFIILIFVIYTIYKKKRSDWADYLSIKDTEYDIDLAEYIFMKEDPIEC